MIKLFLLLILASSASAQVGQSAFAIQSPKFNCDIFLKQFAGVPSPTIALLEGYFGNSSGCINKFIKLRGNKTIEVHIRYIKKNVVEVLDKRLLARRARKWEAFRKKHSDITILLSDGLESHDYTGAARRRVSFIKKHFYGKIVHNPFYERDPYIVGADIIELHGARYAKSWRRKTIFSYDGFGIAYSDKDRGRDLFQTSIPDVRRDIEKAKRDGSILFLWDAPSQGIVSVANNPIPAKRTFNHYWINLKNLLLKQ